MQLSKASSTMSEWRECRLGEVLDVHHGWAFKGEHFAEAGELIVLTPGNFNELGGFKPKSGTEKFYRGTFPDRFLLPRGAVVVAMTEQAHGLLGSSATIPEEGRYLHNQRIGLLEVTNAEALDLRFSYHLMNTPHVRRQIQATSTGSKVRHTAPARIRDVSVALPPIATQQAAASALDAIDTLVENNLRRVEVLEGIARTIYREWFVRFRYPGRQVAPLSECALGSVPAGWEVSTLAAIADITMGQSPRSEYYNDEGLGRPFHQGVTDFGSHFPVTTKWCTVEGRTAIAGDILVSVRAPVGRINIADVDMTIGRGLSAIRARDGRQALLLGQLREVFAEEDSLGNDGAIFKSLGKAELASLRVVVPPPDVADAANTMLAANRDMIRGLVQAATRLTSLRDLLLPRLVTGQTLDLSAGFDGPYEEAIA